VIERPILFSAPMVRAIIDGRKTQTRRIVKVLTGEAHHPPYAPVMWLSDDECTPINSPEALACCPYGPAGDRLWVRETWAHVPITAYRCSEGVQQTANPNDPDMAAVYAASWERSKPGRWRPSIHMPRWASRLTLETTGVRVERLQEISEDDALAEGIEGYSGEYWGPDSTPTLDIHAAKTSPCHGPHPTAASAYRQLWELINGADSWIANPWVWVIEFKRVTP
jgi:hypothetical protein